MYCMSHHCIVCNSDKTYIRKNGYECWFNYRDGKICNKCYFKLIANPRYYKNNRSKSIENALKWYKNNPDKAKKMMEKWREKNLDELKVYRNVYNQKKLVYKGKTVILKENPRTGQCSKCKRKVGEGIKLTVMHHLKYHDEDPLKDTIELCVRCHNKAHHRRYRLYKNKPGGYMRFYKTKKKKKGKNIS